MSERAIIELNDSNWEKLVEKDGKPIVVMFFSPLCPHCLAMMPFFEKYADEFNGKISFGRIDVTRNSFTVSRYGVMSTPTFKFFCSGRPVQEIVGEIYPTLLKKITEDALEYGSSCASKSTPIDFNLGYA
jgi:thioredoxin 1